MRIGKKVTKKTPRLRISDKNKGQGYVYNWGTPKNNLSQFLDSTRLVSPPAPCPLP
ncbi:hypothetical protein COO91_01683 [Nostoc flagelliforme CCNUN1]|uniref:Uncharacterized protein n=1 Tax=Nostoc flagelliforme CCNUN1 TaxID=2038116 RepID=A0A2K8SK34_9NOSO|nr:hypothetical protein COO91_01683 [Nostoc flagelliforme CCNUN1]